MRRIVWSSVVCLALTANAAGQHSTTDRPASWLAPSLDGRDNFNWYCSPCHGRTGAGDGPVAPALKTRPADLTTLARRAGGAYPARRVENYVTNGGLHPAHGSSEMPVWGPTFLALEPSDTLVKTRIANVVRYIESIQARSPGTARGTE